jgi:hypothetical protein
MKKKKSETFSVQFRNPSNAFRPAPFWFWNHRLEEKELLRQMDEMAAHGLGGFVMHARHGLRTPYMGAEWMECVEKCCEKAEKMGLWAWLYDEENWPSGPVGGRLFENHPEYRMSQIYISDETRADGGKFAWQPRVGDALLYILAYREDTADWSARLEHVVDLTSKYNPSKGLKCALPKGKWRVVAFSKTIYTGYFAGGYIDVFNREATREFIRMTHEVYTDRVGEYYGRCLKGIFTDEPSMYYSGVDRSVPWTTALPAEFEKEHGYPYRKIILALFEDTGAGTVKFRNDFMSTVTRLYRDNFLKPIHDYCEKHGILLIGHVNSEGEFLSQIREQGDFFETAKYLHWGGCDTLFDNTWPKPDTSNNLLGTKFASSAAHLLGKPRVMAEAFGVAAGWQLTLCRLKWLGDWQAAMGVNYFLPHAAYYSLEGFRKWECPPDESYHNPYWKYYKLFADHLGRLCQVFSNGRHRARTALLSPVAAARGLLRAGRLYYFTSKPDDNNKGAYDVQFMLEAVSETMLRNQFDFDLINEELIQKARVSKNADGNAVLEVRDKKGKLLEDFEMLVLPAAKVISKKTITKLREFAGKGGRIVFVGGTPSAFTETGADADAEAAVKALVADYPRTVAAVQTPGEEFVQALKAGVQRDVEVGNAPDFVYLKYEKKEGVYFLLFNTSEDKRFEPSEIALRAAGHPYLFDTETGDISALEPKKHDGEGTVIHLSFAPRQTHVVLVSKERLGFPAVVERKASGLKPIEFADRWKFNLDSDNYLPLSTWTMSSVSTADKRGWLSYHHHFTTTFDVKDVPAKLYLLADGLMRQEIYGGHGVAPVQIMINGAKVEGLGEGTHYDRLVPEADVAGLVKPGKNTIEIQTKGGMHEAATVTQLMYLAGKFSLDKEGDAWAIVAPRAALATGSWAEQGYPFFSGHASYEQTISIPAEYVGKPLRVVFENVAETVEVWVNGECVGVRVWAPWELPVERFVKAGDNTFVFKVTNTLYNVFRNEPRASGLIGRVRLVSE